MVDMHEAELRLDELVARAEAGEEVVISRTGVAAVRLVPVEKPPLRRKLGWLAGTIDLPPDHVLIGEDPDVLARAGPTAPRSDASRLTIVTPSTAS